MRVLALDFDGVISDSAPEAFVVALRTYTGMRQESRFAGNEGQLGGGALPSAEAIRADALFAEFVRLMPLGNRAEDYGVVLSALDRELPLDDQAAYDAARAAESQGFLDEFHRLFYRERTALREADPRGWRALLGPYPDFVSLLRRRAADALLAIATAKDGASVGVLLRDYGIDGLFADDRVLDKEAGRSKQAHLRVLQERTGAPWSDITFVDDKVNHLQDVAPLGVGCALAAWGYNGEREHAIAREHGFAVCDLAHAEETLFG